MALITYRNGADEMLAEESLSDFLAERGWIAESPGAAVDDAPETAPDSTQVPALREPRAKKTAAHKQS